MSASSGISPSPELLSHFSSALQSKSVRFLKVSIVNESLLDISIPVKGSFEEDLIQLQDSEILQENVPAYLLARLDDPPTEWLAIDYVPDSAKVRDKMLYASTRASLLKSLGPAPFTDTMYATSKSDLTPQAYASHKKHINAPKPLSAREQELADVRAAEREAGGGGYDGSRTRLSHVGTGVGYNWSGEVEEAVVKLGEGEGPGVVVVKIDVKSETLILDSTSDITAESLGSTLPASEPCYAFFAWPHTYTNSPQREIVFIYSCPTTSPIKHRMVYSSGATTVFRAAESIFAPSLSASSHPFPSRLANRKIETSDPTELDERYLMTELGLFASGTSASSENSVSATPNDVEDEKKPFARPKGPARRR